MSILSIAGSDPTGGAGIQADIKTITTLGGYAAAIPTCITVQNSESVRSINPLPPQLVKNQIEAVLVDQNITHIKIGMIGTMAIANELAKILTNFKGEVIFDPVLSASSGDKLTEPIDCQELEKTLVSKVTVLTPNRNELSKLAGRKIEFIADALDYGRFLISSNSRLKAVIIKGGHWGDTKSTVCDYLLRRGFEPMENRRKRYPNQNLHGTGCTYASAFATYHSFSGSYKKSFTKTGEYMNRLIKKSTDVQIAESIKNGPLCHYLM